MLCSCDLKTKHSTPHVHETTPEPNTLNIVVNFVSGGTKLCSTRVLRIGIVLDKSLNNGVMDIKCQGDMIILVKLLVKIWFLMLLVLTLLK
jgi:hypothetical protein